MEETRQNPEIFVAVTHSGEKFKAFALKRADGTNRLYLFVLPLGRSSLWWKHVELNMSGMLTFQNVGLFLGFWKEDPQVTQMMKVRKDEGHQSP